LGNVQDAEDVTSQTFLAAYEALGRYRQNGYFSAWLFTIARNKAMDHYRKKNHLTDVQISEEISADTDPLGGVIVSEQNQMVRNLIDQLPEDEKLLLRLRFLAELSFASIAQLLQRSEAAVKKSTYRVLARLHNSWRIQMTEWSPTPSLRRNSPIVSSSADPRPIPQRAAPGSGSAPRHDELPLRRLSLRPVWWVLAIVIIAALFTTLLIGRSRCTPLCAGCLVMFPTWVLSSSRRAFAFWRSLPVKRVKA
jgi:RNA polymerase sigma-70 factor (ECF subfamily)